MTTEAEAQAAIEKLHAGWPEAGRSSCVWRNPRRAGRRIRKSEVQSLMSKSFRRINFGHWTWDFGPRPSRPGNERASRPSVQRTRSGRRRAAEAAHVRRARLEHLISQAPFLAEYPAGSPVPRGLIKNKTSAIRAAMKFSRGARQEVPNPLHPRVPRQPLHGLKVNAVPIWMMPATSKTTVIGRPATVARAVHERTAVTFARRYRIS